MSTRNVPAASASAELSASTATTRRTRRPMNPMPREQTGTRLGNPWPKLGAAVQAARTARALGALEPRVLEQRGAEHVAAEVGRVDDLAPQGLVQPLRLAQRERLRQQRERLAD